MKTIKVKRLSDRATLPTRHISTDAGLDLYASESVFIPVGTTAKIKTDIALHIDPGYYGQINDRSSMAAKGLRVGAGVVDHGYNGHMYVILHNISNKSESLYSEKPLYNLGCEEPWAISKGTDFGYQINTGDRIAQLVVHKIELPTVEEVDSFEESERGSDGFGSSGK